MKAEDGRHFPSRKFVENYDNIFRRKKKKKKKKNGSY